MNLVTSECSVKHATVSDRSVSVVDTPGLFDTQIKPEEFMKEIARSIYLSSPGPHAFLIVLPVNMKFIDQELQILWIIELLFGKEVLKYSIILFTHGDLLKEPVEKLVVRNSKLRHLVDQCGGRFHVFNNRDQNNIEQVNDLLRKIDTMIKQTGGEHYSNQMFEDSLKFRREEEEKRQREEERKQQDEKQRQEEIERVRKETEEKIRAEIEAKHQFELERLKARRQREYEERERQQKQKQVETERVIKDIEVKIRADIEAKSRSELQKLVARIQREDEERTQLQKQRQNEIETVREMIQEIREEIEAERAELEKHRARRQRENKERKRQQKQSE
ncbi:GTPase IMAP family member 9 [Labeo rohita]|uniref:GTPase IMAP family member 9 n=1 Tax=Labeo rohita TaxID=84645 RepID=A0ABQ8MV73_LABRO|nr:GTPase IMAP family member 9 [Labeo rohita]